jgi:ADP-ribosylglycohydrolase
MWRSAAALILILGQLPSVCAGEVNNARYYDKVRGAWLGKCIGGALGMPIECWHYSHIQNHYPSITGYIGYFDKGEWRGWSGLAASVNVPADNQWRHFCVRIDVPKFDSKSCYADVLIGRSVEFAKTPAKWEMRDVRFLRPQCSIAFTSDDWQTWLECRWTEQGTVAFDCDGERSWLRLSREKAKSLRLKPHDSVLLAFDARCESGDGLIGFALDYVTWADQKGFGPDDDTSYQIIALHALGTYGPDLSCKQIGREWLEHCPVISDRLAEGIALKWMREGTLPPKSGQHSSGEAVGGQMRGEIWGLLCPGRPDLAAEYARRDAVVSHCKNGVYGEQFIAAITSAAFVESDVRKLIDTGLSVIPSDSEYASVVRWMISSHDRNPEWRDTLKDLIDKYPHTCDPVYAEAGIVALALLYGNGDFSKSICIAASCGSDTDCNTANVGAILGCIHGARAIPARWTGPIDDTFRCFAKGLEDWKISELSKRICADGRRVMAFHGSGMKFTAAD